MEKLGKIGIFDSGIGGVTVFKEILKVLPDKDYIYYSDSKNNPYGEKDDRDVINICDNIVKFLIHRNCRTIVIACNTASAKAANYLRENYRDIQIVAIEPAYKMVYDFAYDDPTLVMATKGTIESEKFNLLYNKYNNNKTNLLACVGLANLIEEGDNKKIKKYLEENLKNYKGKIKNVVLGCTHYPLVKNYIKDILGNVRFFEGSARLARYLKDIIETNESMFSNNSSIEFIDSQSSDRNKKRFYQLLKQ